MVDGIEIERAPNGTIPTPDGRVYVRTPQRVTRRIGDELVAAGAALATDVYPDGLAYYAEAAAIWAEVRPRLVTGSRPPVTDLQWVGRVWEADDGAVLLVFDGEH